MNQSFVEHLLEEIPGSFKKYWRMEMTDKMMHYYWLMRCLLH